MSRLFTREAEAWLKRITAVPTPYPKEFRRDVIAVARQCGQLIAKVARSSGISESCLARWRVGLGLEVDIEVCDGRPGLGAAAQAADESEGRGAEQDGGSACRMSGRRGRL